MFIEKLEEKWGLFNHTGHYYENGSMAFISDQARLNVLFEPLANDEYVEYFRSNLKSELHPELHEFYKKYNGCRLFFGSLNIYGIPKYPEEIFQPYNLRIENLNNFSKMSKKERESCNLLFFGSLGGDYRFGYDKTNPSKICCCEAGSGLILKEFASFHEFFYYYFDVLLDEYDKDCRKIHWNKEDEGIPVLEHLTYKLF